MAIERYRPSVTPTVDGGRLRVYLDNETRKISNSISDVVDELRKVDNILNASEYGLDPEITAGHSAALQAFFTALSAVDTGAIGIINPGVYTISTQVNLPANDGPILILGFGASIRASGAITPIRIHSGGGFRQRVIMGLTVDARDDNDITGGIVIDDASNVSLLDCQFIGDGSLTATFAFVTAKFTTTGGFWNNLERCIFRSDTGASYSPIGVRTIGAMNALRIRDCNFTSIQVPVRLQSFNDNIANAVLIDGCAFEQYGQAVDVSASTSSAVRGLRIANCRFEEGDNVIVYSSAIKVDAHPTVLYGNYYIADAFSNTYVVNPNGITIRFQDDIVSPDIGRGCNWTRGVTLNASSAADWALTMRAVGGNRGFRLQSSNGTNVLQGQVVDQPGGPKVRLNAPAGATSNMYINNIRGLSKGSVDCNNFNGTKTFTATTSRTVSLAVTESDANYIVMLTPNDNVNVWVEGKSINQFVVHTDPTLTGLVSWLIAR